MADTFPYRKRKKAQRDLLDDADDDDQSVDFFITKKTSTEKRHREFKVTDASPGPNFLEILIFAVSVCLWLTSAIILCCHVVLAATKTDAYIFMIHHWRTMAQIALQVISIIVEFVAAICGSFCISYDVEAHNVICIAKLAIGFVCFNVVVFVSVLILGSFGSHAANADLLNDPLCSGLCAHDVDVIIHLLVGCSYEGIAINLITIPVLVWVLREAIVFVKLDQEARREKAIIKESPSSIDLHRKENHHRNSIRRVRFSKSDSSLFGKIIPGKDFNRPPNTSSQSRNDDMRDAVIRVISEDLETEELPSSSKMSVHTSTRNKWMPQDSFRDDHTPDTKGTDSASSDGPWSSGSPTTSDTPKYL